MIKLAKIISINADVATLKIQDENCQSSGCQKGCKKGLLSFLFPALNKGFLTVALNSDQSSHYHVKDSQNFFTEKHRENDIVGLKFSEKHLLKLSLMLYGLPIISMLLIMMVSYKFFSMLNYPADLGGLIGLLSGLMIAKALIKHNKGLMSPSVKFFK